METGRKQNNNQMITFYRWLFCRKKKTNKYMASSAPLRLSAISFYSQYSKVMMKILRFIKNFKSGGEIHDACM